MMYKYYQAYNELEKDPFKSFWAKSSKEAINRLGCLYTKKTAFYRTAWFCGITYKPYRLKPKLIIGKIK